MRSLLLLCMSVPAFCQPGFTVASVKANGAMDRSKPAIAIDPGRIQFTNVTFKTLVTRAYGVKDYQVSGPGWISSDSYTIAATMPPETTQAAIGEMLQSLLVERFQLKVRRTAQELPVYALATGKNGAKLQKAVGGEPATKFSSSGLQVKNMDMSGLANLLTAFLDRPVVDETELKDTYDIVLDFAPDASLGRAMAKLKAEVAASGKEASGPSIFTAIQQAGLRLEPRKTPVEMIVIDSATRVPTEN